MNDAPILNDVHLLILGLLALLAINQAPAILERLKRCKTKTRRPKP
jgi:hypothetical protein